MAHDIGRMFYYGEVPWHRLGNQLSQAATLDEAMRAGGLEWTVSLVPIVPAGEPDSSIEHRVAVVRDDRAPGDAGRVVGVVHPGFRPLQNRDGAQIFDALLGQGTRVYHTGGYLRHGEVIWLLAKLPVDILVGGTDPVEPYLLFTNSHDGSVAIDIRLTTVRVVCRNTLSLALNNKAKGRIFRHAHDGSYALLKQEAKAFFDFSIAQCEETQALFTRLAAKKCDAAAFKAFLRALLPDPARPVTADQNGAVRKAYETRMENLCAARKEVEAVFRDGIPQREILPAGETWWGAVNAVTGWVDHLQPVAGDRYAYALLGSGDKLKSAALTRAVDLCS